MKSAQTTDSEKAAAAQQVTSTVLKGTGLAADGESPQMLAKLTAELVDSGKVGLHGLEEAVALTVSAEDAKSIPPKVLNRLKKLV